MAKRAIEAKSSDSALPAETIAVRNVADSEMATLFGLPVEASPREWRERGVQAFNQSGYQMAVAGFCFKKLKQSAGKGNFHAALEEAGISEDHATRAITLAEYLQSLDPDQRRRMIAVPYTKALACAKAEPEVVRALLDAGKLDGDQPLSVRDLQKELAKEKLKNSSLALQLEGAKAREERIKARALNRLQDAQMPEFCVVAREESTALSEQISLSLDGIELLIRDNLLMPHDDVAEAEKFAEIAAGTAFHALRGLHARLGQQLGQLADHFPAVIDKVGFEHQLKPGEVEGFKHAREMVLGRIKTAADNRAAERHNAKGGRGRPRKVK